MAWDCGVSDREVRKAKTKGTWHQLQLENYHVEDELPVGINNKSEHEKARKNPCQTNTRSSVGQQTIYNTLGFKHRPFTRKTKLVTHL